VEWSDFPTFAANGTDRGPEWAPLIRLALMERCGWVGDQAGLNTATALSTTKVFTRAWLTSVRTIIASIAPKFVSGHNCTAMSVDSLLGDIYSEEGYPAGGATAFAKYLHRAINGNYWSIAGPGFGSSTASVARFNVMVLYHIFNRLRWVGFTKVSEQGYQKVGDYDEDRYTAFMNSHAATATTYDGGKVGFRVYEWYEEGTKVYEARLWRQTQTLEYTNEPLAGYYPVHMFENGPDPEDVVFGSAAFMYQLDDYVLPHEMTLVVGNAPNIGFDGGATGGTSFEMTQGTPLLRKFSMPADDWFPTDTTKLFVRLKHQSEFYSSVSNYTNQFHYAFKFFLKPATIYGV